MRVTSFLVLVAVAASAAIGPTENVAHAAGVAFLDERPVVIDLAVADQGDRWSVEVLVPLTGAVDSVAVTPVMSPLTLSVRPLDSPPRPVSTTTGIIDFSIQLEDERASSGALVLSNAEGVLARRPVRVLTAGTNLGIPDELVGHGLRTHPFGGGVRVRPIEFPDPDVPQPRVVGRLFNGSDSAEVVQTSLDLVFNGIDGTGRYKGVVDLAPGIEGGASKVEVAVRDQVVWPLVAIVVGLVVVSVLDIGRRRKRPERVFALELRRLVERAATYQRRSGVSLRVTDGRRNPLLLDQLTSEAMANFRAAMDDDTRDADALREPTKEVVDRFVKLCEQQEALTGKQQELLAAVPPSRHESVQTALASSVVGRALAPTLVRTSVGLEAAETAVTAASDFLSEFSTTLRRLLSAVNGANSATAHQLLERLLNDPYRLQEVAEAARQLQLVAPERRVVPVSDGRSRRPLKDVEGDAAPPYQRSAPKKRALAGASAVAVGLVLVALVLSGQGSFPGSDGWTAGGGGEPPATGLAPAPTEGDLVPHADVEDGASQDAFRKAALVAMAGLAGAGGLAWIALRPRSRSRHEEQSAAELERELRQSDRHLSIITGLLVVLSGLATLYVPNESFGTVGDYLGALLWGTTLTAGVELARRFGGHAMAT